MWRSLSPPPASPRARKQLERKTPLKRSGPLKRRHLRVVDDPAREIWKTPVGGICSCGCYEWVPRLERHHVLLAQIVRREHGDEWSIANSMLVAEDCHLAHHLAVRKIPLDQVPIAAVEFAVDLLGEARAIDYFRRRYGLPDGAGWIHLEDHA